MRAYNPGPSSAKNRVVSSTSQRAIPASVQRRPESASPVTPVMIVVGLAIVAILAVGGWAISTALSKKTNTPASEPQTTSQVDQHEPAATQTVEPTHKPVVKPIVHTTVKPVEKPVEKPVVHEHPVAHKPKAHVTPAADIPVSITTATPPPKKHKKHSSDFYDFQSNYENTKGDPVSLPVKDWSGN